MLAILWIAGVVSATSAQEAESVPPLTPAQEAVVRKLVEAEVQKRLEERSQASDKSAAVSKPPEPNSDQKSGPPEGVVGQFQELKSVWRNGLQMSSADESFRIHIGGRVDYDNVFFTQSDNILLGTNDTTRLQDGSGFRRVRLRTDGSFWEHIDFAVEVNFANFQDFSNTDQQIVVGAVGLTDVWLTFRDLPWIGKARVGHFAPPIGLEHVTSNNFVYYMERSPQFDAFLNRFDYVDGAMAFDSFLDDRATYAVAAIRTGSRTVNPFGAGAGDGEYGGIARATLLPLWEDDGRRLIHTGLSLMHRVLDGKSTGPGSRALIRAGAARDELPNIVQTGNFFGPEGSNYLNLEFAAVNGPWSLSGEFLWVNLPSAFGKRSAAGVYSDPRGEVNYYGYYIEAGYFVTPGDYRRYNRSLGCWDRTIPMENGYLVRGEDGRPVFGRGAVQLLCRLTYLDIAGGDPVLSPATGARAGMTTDMTLGVNWFLNSQSNISLNYIHTNIASVVAGHSGGFDGVGVRVHFDF
jgi:phosphate-selective porin OprO/OprP